MTITHIVGLAIAVSALLPAAPAAARPFSYAREHHAACAEAWEKRDGARQVCGSRDFCAAHGNDDRISRMVCDPYESKADGKLDSVTLSGAWLDAARNLSEAETQSKCDLFVEARTDRPCNMVQSLRKKAGATGGDLLPAQMKAARLALRAHIQVYTFPATVVRLGIGPHGSGMMEVTWNRNGNGPRETHSARLTPGEIDRLLAAVNRSDFWRLPYWGEHLGLADSEVAAVELSVAGRKHEVHDGIGDAEAVDLSILVNELTRIVKSRWQDVPA